MKCARKGFRIPPIKGEQCYTNWYATRIIANKDRIDLTGVPFWECMTSEFNMAHWHAALLNEELVNGG